MIRAEEVDKLLTAARKATTAPASNNKAALNELKQIVEECDRAVANRKPVRSGDDNKAT